MYLFKKGLSVKEIALERIIKEGTVWEHLANLIECGHLSIWNVFFKRKIVRILSKIRSKNDWLRDIKKRLNEKSITYDEIACVLAYVKFKDKIRRRNKDSLKNN